MRGLYNADSRMKEDGKIKINIKKGHGAIINNPQHKNQDSAKPRGSLGLPHWGESMHHVH